MRAAVFDRFGPPEVLRIAELPDPEPGPGQLRVRVRAAGVQPFDTAVRRGAMPRLPVHFPQTIGQEYAGVVDRVGEGVSELRIGEEVLGSTLLNGNASLVCVVAETAVGKPPDLDFLTAAGLVSAAQTAAGALAELRVGPGDVLLVHGAAGSVGTLAVQLARLSGATVIGTAGPGNHDYLRQLGAVPVAYGKDLVEAVRALPGPAPTVALDAAGGPAIGQSAELGIARERIGTITDDRGAAEHGARVVRAPRDPARLAEVVALAAHGHLPSGHPAAAVDLANGLILPIRAYPLAEVAEAHALVETRHGRGKVVLIVEP